MAITLILPAYNEQDALKIVVEEYLPYVDEIIIVDDGSVDETRKIANSLQSKKVQFFFHSNNMGKVQALRTGVSYASGDIIIFSDADFTYPARYIPEMVTSVKKGWDLVLGARMLGRDNIPFLNRFGNIFFSLIAEYISGVPLRDCQTGYRAFKKEIFNQLDVDAISLEYETKMTVRAAKQGFQIIEIPIEYRERVGLSKLHPFRDGYRMICALISVAWYESSLLARSVFFPGFLFIISGILFGIVSVYQHLSAYYLENAYYPLIAVFLIILGIQLFSLGFIADIILHKLNRIERARNREKCVESR